MRIRKTHGIFSHANTSWLTVFSLLQRTACPRKIEVFRYNMMDTAWCNGSSSELFPIRSGEKILHVLAPTLLMCFSYFSCATPLINQKTPFSYTQGSDWNLSNLPRLRAKTKARRVQITEMILADDAAWQDRMINTETLLRTKHVYHNPKVRCAGWVTCVAWWRHSCETLVWKKKTSTGTRPTDWPTPRYKDENEPRRYAMSIQQSCNTPWSRDGTIDRAYASQGEGRVGSTQFESWPRQI
jgi:hypothetical protein